MDPSQFTAFDFIVFLIMGLAVLYGLAKGVSTIIIRLSALVGAFIIALYFGDWAIGVTRSFIEPDALADIIALPTLFLLSLAVLFILGDFVSDKIRSSAVGPLDRSLGALACMVMAFALISTGYLLLNRFVGPRDQPEWIVEAKMRPLVSYGADMVATVGPDLLRQVEEDADGERIIEDMKKQYSETRENLQDGYNDLERRLLEEKLEQVLKDAEEEANSSDD